MGSGSRTLEYGKQEVIATCFTSTKVQIRTPDLVRKHKFTCFTTKKYKY